MWIVEYIPTTIFFGILAMIWRFSKDVDKLASKEIIASIRQKISARPRMEWKRHHYRSILQLYFGNKHLSVRCIVLSYSLSILIFLWVSVFFDMFLIDMLVTSGKDYGDFTWLAYLLLGVFIVNGTFDYICLGITRGLLSSKLGWISVVVLDFIFKIFLIGILLLSLNYIFTYASLLKGLEYMLSSEGNAEDSAEFIVALYIFWDQFRKMVFGWNITELSIWIPILISAMFVYFLNLFHIFAVYVWQPSRNNFVKVVSKSAYLSENAPIEAVIKTGCIWFGSIYLAYIVPYSITKIVICWAAVW